MVMVKVPVVAVGAALKVIVDVPVPPETRVTVTGLNVAVVPAGGADLVNVIVPLNPFSEVNVIVEVPLVPWMIVTVVGEALMLKSGGAVVVTVRVTVAE
jgi:hypothetical protein